MTNSFFQLELKLVRDEIERYKKRIMAMMDVETETARKLAQEGRRERALIVLKKKKLQSKAIEDSDSKLTQIEELVHGLETAAQNKMMFDAIKIGRDALVNLQKEVNSEGVECLMLDTREALEQQRCVSPRKLFIHLPSLGNLAHRLPAWSAASRVPSLRNSAKWTRTP
mmetsp:Transcript_31768/g.84825  ORF Transcript_31768/g.84825 Transcript_31768/m.84825 type:complete len:169 (-) Transcript_31768:161-667(-)